MDNDPNQRGYHPQEAPFYLGGGKVDTPAPGSGQRGLRRLIVIFASVVAALLLIMGIMVAVLVHMASTPQASPNGITHAQGTTAPPTAAPPTTAPQATNTPTGATATPTATATPAGAPPLCESDVANNWSGWNIQPPWKLLNGTLLTDNSSNSTLIPPANCQPTTRNYAVQETLQVVQGSGQFGFVVRGGSVPGYTVGIDLGYPRAYIDSTQNLGIQYNNMPDASQSHTYRAEVKDNTVTFLIDGTQVMQITDNTYLDPGKIAIFCAGTQLEITDFQVFVLS